jgi:hypothetical protein
MNERKLNYSLVHSFDSDIIMTKQENDSCTTFRKEQRYMNMSIKLTAIKIQESSKLRGLNQDKGITSEDLTTDRVLLADPVQDKIRSLMVEATEYIMDQVADFATENGKDGDKIKASMIANIMKFKLDAGGGYTDTHKASLIANGTDSNVEVIAEDFIDPKNRGGATASVSSSDVTGVIDL